MDSSRTGHSVPWMDPLAAARARSTEPSAAVSRTLPELYRTHFDFVWRSLRRLGVAGSALDDAAQDVFLVVHRKLAEFAGRSSVKTWLFGIVVRVAHDHHRAQRRKGDRTRHQEPHGLEALPDLSSPSPVQRAEQADAVRLLEMLLAPMSAEKREVFYLAELEQFTAPEIAEALGIRLSTVYSRLRAARAEFEEARARFQEREKGGRA
jgi:RNA polymerase sigma-70 factor (ECF subfamily)